MPPGGREEDKGGEKESDSRLYFGENCTEYGHTLLDLWLERDEKQQQLEEKVYRPKRSRGGGHKKNVKETRATTPKNLSRYHDSGRAFGVEKPLDAISGGWGKSAIPVAIILVQCKGTAGGGEKYFTKKGDQSKKREKRWKKILGRTRGGCAVSTGLGGRRRKRNGLRGGET